jgi:hypothetical protein
MRGTRTFPALVIPSRTMPRTISRSAPQALKVGDEVVLRIAGSERRGVVVEDRGPLGVDGRQIVAIRTGDEDDAPQFEVKAEDLERIHAA